MLSHPDPQVQYIFSTLENQRDNLMIENGALAARIKAMESEQAVAPVQDTAQDAASDELSAN